MSSRIIARGLATVVGSPLSPRISPPASPSTSPRAGHDWAVIRRRRSRAPAVPVSPRRGDDHPAQPVRRGALVHRTFRHPEQAGDRVRFPDLAEDLHEIRTDSRQQRASRTPRWPKRISDVSHSGTDVRTRSGLRVILIVMTPTAISVGACCSLLFTAARRPQATGRDVAFDRPLRARRRRGRTAGPCHVHLCGTPPPGVGPHVRPDPRLPRLVPSLRHPESGAPAGAARGRGPLQERNVRP